MRLEDLGAVVAEEVDLRCAPDELLDLEGVAKLLGVHPATVRRRIRDGKLPRPVDARWSRRVVCEYMAIRQRRENRMPAPAYFARLRGRNASTPSPPAPTRASR